MIHLNRLVVLTAILFSAMLLTASSSEAATLPPSGISGLGSCGSQGTSYSDLIQGHTLTGDVYIRLANATETPSTLKLYFQSFQDGTCHSIGTATPQYDAWTKIGSYSGPANAAGSLIVSGNGLGAAPYQAVAQVLFVPDPTLCTPSQSCLVQYQGSSAVLQPQTLSTASDQLAVYSAQPIAASSITKVSYYADSQYMYGGTAYGPFNRNYLPGGSHAITIQVLLANGETLTINQTIDMGLDITSLYFFRSMYYRSHDKALLVGLVASGLIILSFIGWVVRLIRQRRASRRDHGLVDTPISTWVETKDDDI